MFGFFVLNKFFSRFGLALLVMLAGASAWAQAQRATVINDEALVYQEADFDAPVIATLKAGAVYNVSAGKKGPFYKIRLKPGSLGWIADTDVKPGVHRIEEASAEQKMKPLEGAKASEGPKRKPFFATRYGGLGLNVINYTEDTLGEKRSAFTNFYGLNFNGYDVVMSGEIYTEANFMLALSPPSYYTDYTKAGSEGFIFIADFLFQTVNSKGKSALFHYGFGPMFKYSHFLIGARNGAQEFSYSVDDMSIGAVFNIGLALRLGNFSIRPDVKYYWEKDTYYGFALNVGYQF